MEKLVKTLEEKIHALEVEGKKTQGLDTCILENVRSFQRANQIKEINAVLSILAVYLKTRAAKEFFLYADKSSHVNIKFIFISNQEIELYLKINPKQIEYPLWGDSRITYYTEFIDRSKKLLKKIKNGDLDQTLNQPPKKMLCMIMGPEGELLDQNEKDITSIKLAEITASVRYWQMKNINYMKSHT